MLFLVISKTAKSSQNPRTEEERAATAASRRLLHRHRPHAVAIYTQPHTTAAAAAAQSSKQPNQIQIQNFVSSSAKMAPLPVLFDSVDPEVAVKVVEEPPVSRGSRRVAFVGRCAIVPSCHPPQPAFSPTTLARGGPINVCILII